MSRMQCRDYAFWTIWVLGALATVLSVTAVGVLQSISEFYLASLAVANSIFVISVTSSRSVQASIAMYIDRRRTPHLVEWAGILLMVIVGVMLSNWFIFIGAVISLLTKPACDRICEKLLRQTFFIRAIRDGAIHPDELK